MHVIIVCVHVAHVVHIYDYMYYMYTCSTCTCMHVIIVCVHVHAACKDMYYYSDMGSNVVMLSCYLVSTLILMLIVWSI